VWAAISEWRRDEREKRPTAPIDLMWDSAPKVGAMMGKSKEATKKEDRCVEGKEERAAQGCVDRAEESGDAW